MGKIGIDYFPSQCQDTTAMELLEAEFGLKAGAVVHKLYQLIFGELGYYCVWNKEVQLLFSRKKCNLPSGDNCVSEIVSGAVRRGIFDKDMLEKEGILTSVCIQETFFEAAKRRVSVQVEKRYLLIPVAKLPQNADINGKNVNINEENADINEQRREEKSKEKKKNKEHSPKHRYGKYSHVTLTNEEGAKLVAEFGQKNTDNAIKYLDEYVERKGYKHSSSYLTIRKWVFDALKKEGIYDEGYNAGNKGEQAGRKIYGTVL